jgi:hypothetical protein
MSTKTQGRVLAILVGLCLLAGLGCGNKGAADKKAAAGGAPKIAAVEAVFDFGKVKQGQDVEHVFKVRNQGSAELRIEQAKGS